MEATRNGSPSIRTSAAWVTDSSTSFGLVFLLVTSEEFNRSTDGGVTWHELRLIFQTLPIRERWTWIPTATFFSAEEGTPFSAFARATPRIGGQTPTFDQITPVNMGGDLIQGGINGIGLCGQTFLASGPFRVGDKQ